jgi:hypothetical protein
LRIFAVRWFVRFARKESIGDKRLCDAVERARRGVIDAQLGAGLIKQRVARSGSGRSGGYRVLIALRTRWRAVFLYGFAKNERENLDDEELADLKTLAARFMSLTEVEMKAAVSAGELKEIFCDGEEDA